MQWKMESVVQRGRGKRESYKANGERFSYNANFHKLVRNSFIFLCSFLQNSTSMWGTHCVWPAAGKEQSAMRVRQSKVMWAECGGGGGCGRAYMHGTKKDFRPLFSHGVRQLVCHRTNFKLFTHTPTLNFHLHVCVCVCFCDLN